MQLGGRFSIGESPRGVSENVLAQLRLVEATLSDEEKKSLRWTMTWLENRPILELDNGEVVRG
ncbi:MAG: hypothetical protein QNL53_00950 [Microbacteriaceae bacterium]|tara:strand:+ start:907 stop:1095 length:189 start_codon:yes stop_codon:yes gene_type:complete